MATIVISSPEKDQPSVIRLQGPRVTVGRLAANTLQIIDRTISSFHAELVLEDGHYYLHDLGSTNGTFVDGLPTSHFHLQSACQISFGSVVCAFDPATTEPTATSDSIPTRAEITALRAELSHLTTSLANSREEVETLRNTKPVPPAIEAIAREDFMKIVAERVLLKEAKLRLELDAAHLKSEVAVLRRDRENLQKALNTANTALANSPSTISPPPAEPAKPTEAPKSVGAPPPPIPLSRPPAAPPTARPAPPASAVPMPVQRVAPVVGRVPSGVRPVARVAASGTTPQPPPRPVRPKD